jgi:hypothetical protein
MKRMLFFGSFLAMSAFIFPSCMKEEKPYQLSGVPDGGDFKISQKQVHIGEDYATQVYFSLNTGQVSSGSYKSWDISFTTGAENPELWMNGGKEVLIYPTGNTNYAAVTALGEIPATAWKYDNPSGLQGRSGLGVLSNQNHVGEVMIADDGEHTYFKLQILEITATQYKIKVGPLETATGTDVTLDKDENYNYVFYSFTGGKVKPEPPKKDWDFLFTRYRHVYYGYNPDGSDFLYLVNGVLTNPYKTKSGDDTKGYEFYNFTLADAEKYALTANRDIIGFDWKVVDINSGGYTVLPKAIFVIKDQQDALWKLHFTGFYDGQGKKGNPSFEYQRLK